MEYSYTTGRTLSELIKHNTDTNAAERQRIHLEPDGKTEDGAPKGVFQARDDPGFLERHRGSPALTQRRDALREGTLGIRELIANQYKTHYVNKFKNDKTDPELKNLLKA